MKKTAQLLSLFSFGALLAVFFMSPNVVWAYTVVSNPAPQPFNSDLRTQFTAPLWDGSGSGFTQFVATGTPMSVTAYIAVDGIDGATMSTAFRLRVRDQFLSTWLDCQTPYFTGSQLALQFNSGGLGAFQFRLLGPFTGTACPLIDRAAFNANRYTLEPDSYPNIAGAGTLAVGSWYNVTTDTGTSTVYAYESTAIGVATSSNASYCNSSFGGLSVGAGFANALCNAGAFLFIPASETLGSFATLGNDIQQKIPFSYYYDVSSIVNGSSASTTQNMRTFTINMDLLDFASSTAMGSILPSGNFDFLSSTTINRFLPAGMHDTLYTMAEFAIWLELMWLIYQRVVPHKAKI